LTYMSATPTGDPHATPFKRLGTAIRSPRRADERLGDTGTSQTSGTTGRHFLCRRHPRPRAVSRSRGARGRRRDHGRSETCPVGPAIRRQRRRPGSAVLDRGPYDRVGRALRQRQHSRHLGLAAGLGLSGSDASHARRYDAGSMADLSRRVAGFQRLRAAL